MEQRFAPALKKIQELLEAASRQLTTPIRSALIGGLAVSAWGVVRATQDIDFLADSDPSPLGNTKLRTDLKKFIEQQRCHAEWRVGEPDDPIPLLLRIKLPRPNVGLGADILWVHKLWQREALVRTISVSVSRLRVRVLHPEDLILLKLEAGGPQDLLDVKELLSSPPPELSVRRLKEAASRLRLAALLEKCLRQIKGKG